jgi:hypothetical protein
MSAISSRKQQHRGGVASKINPRKAGPQRPTDVVSVGKVSEEALRQAFEAGMTLGMAQAALDVASIPKDLFEQAVESEDPPSVEELVKFARWLRSRAS